MPSDDSLSNDIGIYQRRSLDHSPDFTYYENPLLDGGYDAEDLNDWALQQPLPLPQRNDPYVYLTPLDDTKEHTRPLSPFGLPLVPADIAERFSLNDASSSDDYVTDERSCDFPEKTTYVDTATGSDEPLTKDMFDYVVDGEIMINYPPYFEFSDFPKQYPLIPPPQEYTIAPVRDDPLYSLPHNSSRTRSREQNRNAAFEMEIINPRQQPVTGYHSLDTHYIGRWRNRPDRHTSSTPTRIAQAVSEKAKNEMGTQTHVTFAGGIEDILVEIDDTPRIQNEMSGASGRNDPSQAIIFRTQHVRSLPAANDDVSITQASDLAVSRTARWGSASSGARIRNNPRNIESESGPNPMPRGVLRRTSSRISQQLRKAAFAAKKYTKRTVVVAVLIVLALGALVAMLAVFLSR